MKDSQAFSRRRFLQTGLLASATVAVAAGGTPTFAGPTKEPRDPYHGLKMGIASYTFRQFSLDQALEMTRQTGLKYINLKDAHLSLKSTPEQCAAAKAKVEAAGLTLMGGGVIYMKNDEPAVRKIFEYARNAGMPTIVCSPDPDALDLVEKMAKEFSLRIAIHNHGPTDTKYPSPLDVLRLVDHRDPCMGICMDVGHTVRIGQDPVQIISQCRERLYDFHMKDVTTATAKGSPTEVGRGVIDIVGVYKAILDIKFTGHVGLEYEAHGDAPMPGVIESLAYIRGVLAAV